MIQEHKELLIKDLCSRLNTNLVCSIYRVDDFGVGWRNEILSGYCKGDIWDEFYFGDDCGIGIDNVSKIKPYLFPLSSMTEEQLYELRELFGFEIEFGDGFIELSTFHHSRLGYLEMDTLFEWFDRNHFDYRGLISMGLALNATNLNIY